MGIRAIVIDDSAFMRKMITDILESDPRISVIGTARNGKDGLEKIRKLSPDVVTLDVEMPEKDGMETLEDIMSDHPLPVVMLSSVTTDGASKTVQAIAKGAIDFIAKPSGPISLNIAEIREEIIEKVITAAQVTLKKEHKQHQPAVKEQEASYPEKRNQKTFDQPHARTIVAVGTSTGGPRALLTLLKGIPADIPAPIVIVQHMPAGFTKSLAERLDHTTDLHVKEAEHGEILQNGHAYIAPGDHHMEVRQVGTAFAIELTKEPKRNGHRPSVDVLFESLAKIQKVNKLAVVLTGMGSDGAKGIKQMKKADSKTVVIAEDKETSVVYGMPKAAVLTNCVDHIAHLQQISGTILNLVRKTRGI